MKSMRTTRIAKSKLRRKPFACISAWGMFHVGRQIKTALVILFIFTAVAFASCTDAGNSEKGSDSMTESGITEDSDTGEGKTVLPVSDSEIDIAIDFSERDYGQIPYLKKFDMFAATWAWCNDFTASPQLDAKNLGRIADIAELLPETIRTDLFMGYWGIGREIGNSPLKNGTTDEEYKLIKGVTDALKASGLDAEFIYFASPVYTGGGINSDAWKSVEDLEKWNGLCYNIASYFKNNGMNVKRQELWNEPDYYISDPEKDGVYFMGSWQDYIDLYISGAKGIREADSDVLIGGVSAAWMNKIARNGEFDAFLTQSLAAGILPDYVSWHFYGSNGGMKMLEEYISGARDCLEKSDDYATVQQHLNEFNVSLDTSVTSGYDMVRLVLNTYSRLLDATDITRVSWTSALDRNLEGSDAQALINPKTGERTPAYYTQWMYARLPVAPVKVSSDTDRVTVLASVGNTRAAFIAYDTAFENSTVTFDLNGVDFKVCDVKVYTIDRRNPQNKVSSNSPVLLGEYQNVETENMKYTVTIPEDGAIYVEINERDAEINAHERRSALADKAVRTDYWYDGRCDGGAYAWVSTKSFVASLGSGTSENTVGTACAVTLDGMKGAELSLDTTVSDGLRKKSEQSMFGIIVSYSAEGEYVKSVYYGLNGIDGKRTVPLGTCRDYDLYKALGEGSGVYRIALDSDAPENWDGRIQLTFIVNDVEKSNGAEFIVDVG